MEFAEVFGRYRGELLVHCYRMVGSFDEAEDLVQETFLRAWRGFGGFEGRASVRAWLYRIATNVCLDALEGRGRRVLPQHLVGASGVDGELRARADIAWLQPFPGRVLEAAGPREAEPDAVVVGRETIELAFLAAIQLLPPRQRAVLIVRDVLGWPAKETAALLEGSVASVNSALQRARATLKEHLPERRMEWAPVTAPTEAERAVLRRYMEAVERADLAGVAKLLAEEVRTMMPPYLMWFQGRDTVMAALAGSWDTTSPEYVGRFRLVPVEANRQPAAATYLRRPGERDHQAFAIAVLRIEDDHITEITAFHERELFRAFGLPTELPPSGPMSSRAQPRLN